VPRGSRARRRSTPVSDSFPSPLCATLRKSPPRTVRLSVPFPSAVREAVLLRSERFCCVCHEYAGRDMEVHHIVHEAAGGANTLDNAIGLCSRCHGEAGHYNPGHPRGTKFSPSELKRHRDSWWEYISSRYQPEKQPDGFDEPVRSGRGVPLQSREVGVLWSRRADIPCAKETYEFKAHRLAEVRSEDASGVTLSELFALPEGTYFVYSVANHRCDYAEARFHNPDPPDESPSRLTLDDLHETFPALATAAGLQRVRRF